MVGLLDGVEELSQKGQSGRYKLPLFPLSLALFVLRKVLETNIWIQFIRTQLMVGLVWVLKRSYNGKSFVMSVIE